MYQGFLLFLSTLHTLRDSVSEITLQIQLSEVPESISQLISEIRVRLELHCDFTPQFEYLMFGNALCKFATVSELPTEHAVS